MAVFFNTAYLVCAICLYSLALTGQSAHRASLCVYINISQLLGGWGRVKVGVGLLLTEVKSFIGVEIPLYTS